MCRSILFSFLLLTVSLNIINAEEVEEEYDPYLDIPFKRLKTTADRIREHGYPAESHFVETSDGYVLNLFRIPYSPTLENKDVQKPAVLLQHGLFSCSDCFILNGPDDAIAFNFADRGFDVWLGNGRGNVYSRNNTKISINNPKFWDFSWHEIGYYDIPAMIDYILEETKEEKIHYVGHSQGTTVFFVMASTRPEYNDKIKQAHMLAPPVYMGNVTDGMVVGLAPYVGIPDTIYSDLLGTQQFFPSNPIVSRLLDTLCGGVQDLPEYCRLIFTLWTGGNVGNLNQTLLPIGAETHPAGISSNQAIHYIQLYVSNEFRQFDHGKKNIKIYGQATPPDYPLDKITADMYIYYGLADETAHHMDIQRLPFEVPNVKWFHQIPDETWGHLDFLLAMQVKEVINENVIGFCEFYESIHSGEKAL